MRRVTDSTDGIPACQEPGGWDTLAPVSTPRGPALEMSCAPVGEGGEGNPAPATLAPRQGRSPSLGFLGLAAACIVPVIYFAYVWHYGVNSFWEDEWSRVALVDTARHGNLTLSLLWTQYNENRMLIPNLFWVFFGLTTRADAKTIMLFDACLFTASYAFLLTIYRRTVGRWLDPLQTVVVGLVWFSVADWENALWAFQMAWYLIIFFLLAMLLALSRREITPVALAIAMVFAAAASFSSLQGLFAWPVGLLCILWRLDGRARRLSYAAPWVAMGAVVTGLYFWHYGFQGSASVGFGFDLRNPNLVVGYVLAAMGNVFPGGASSVAVHALIGIPLLLAAVWVLGAGLRDRIGAPGPHPLPLPAALIVFALLFDISIGLGRVSLGIDGALASRYTMANLLMVLGIVLFALPRLPRWPRVRGLSPSPIRTAVAVMLVVVLVAQIASGAKYGLDNGRATYGQRVTGARLAVNLSDIPAAARGPLASRYLYLPYPSIPVFVTIARQDGLGPFAPGPYQHYRALGPPREAVRKALATASSSLAAWCNIIPGDPRARLYSALGSPGGTQFAQWAAAHPEPLPKSMPYAEWDVGDDVLVAVFQKGKIHASRRVLGNDPQPRHRHPLPCDAELNGQPPVTRVCLRQTLR